MKEEKTARMRNGSNRKLFTVYFYDGWYSIKGGKMVGYCGDSSVIYNGGNLNNVRDYDIFNLGEGKIENMKSLVKHVNEHTHEN